MSDTHFMFYHILCSLYFHRGNKLNFDLLNTFYEKYIIVQNIFGKFILALCEQNIEIKNSCILMKCPKIASQLKALNLFDFECRIEAPFNMLLENQAQILQVMPLMTKDRFTNDQIRSIIPIDCFVGFINIMLLAKMNTIL